MKGENGDTGNKGEPGPSTGGVTYISGAEPPAPTLQELN